MIYFFKIFFSNYFSLIYSCIFFSPLLITAPYRSASQTEVFGLWARVRVSSKKNKNSVQQLQ